MRQDSLPVKFSKTATALQDFLFLSASLVTLGSPTSGWEPVFVCCVLIFFSMYICYNLVLEA